MESNPFEGKVDTTQADTQEECEDQNTPPDSESFAWYCNISQKLTEAMWEAICKVVEDMPDIRAVDLPLMTGAVDGAISNLLTEVSGRLAIITCPNDIKAQGDFVMDHLIHFLVAVVKVNNIQPVNLIAQLMASYAGICTCPKCVAKREQESKKETN